VLCREIITDNIWRVRCEYWIIKATDTHSEHVILTAFPLQQWLHERASLLRYTYIACPLHFTVQNRCLENYMYMEY